MTKELEKLEAMIKAEIASLQDDSEAKDPFDKINRCNQRIGLRTALSLLYEVALEEEK